MGSQFTKLLLSLLLCGSASAATTWFVDSTAGGSHNGTSWANAWTSLAQIAGVAAGDTVQISGGASGATNTYSPGSWTPINGTAGNAITYQIGQDASHNGTAKFSGTGNFLTGTIKNLTLSGDAGDGAQHFLLSGYSGVYNGGSATGLRISYLNTGQMNPGVSGHIFTFGTDALNNNVEIDHIYTYMLTGDGWLWVPQGTAASGYDAFLIHDNTVFLPKNGAFGTDGIQCQGNGFSFYNNNFTGYASGYSGGQHQDAWQSEGGQFIKLYNNIFANLGNSAIYVEGWGNYNHVRIYNNIVRMVDGLGDYGIHVTTGEHAPINDTIADLVCANNLIDGGGAYGFSLIIQTYNNTGSYSSSILANNVAISNGAGAAATIAIPGVTGGVTVQSNTILTSAQAVSDYAAYTAMSLNNNYHLTAAATSLILKATNETAFFTVDYAGTTRQSTPTAWDSGPYLYGATTVAPSISVQPVGYTNAVGQNFNLTVTAAGTVPLAYQWKIAGLSLSGATTSIFSRVNAQTIDSGAYTVVITNAYGAITSSVANVLITNSAVPIIAISKASLDFGYVATNTVNTLGVNVKNVGSGTLSWTASTSSPFSVSPASGSLAAGAAQTLTVTYSPTANAQDIGQLAITGGGGTNVALSGVSFNVLNVTNITMAAGTLLSGMVLSASTVYSPVVNQGSVVIGFSLPNQWTNLSFIGLSEATNTANNSVFFNVDSPIYDTNSIWDMVPITNTVISRQVSWRGNGNETSPQFTNAVFNVGSGIHYLSINAREPYTRVGTISGYQYSPTHPVAPLITSQPQSQIVLAGSTVSFFVTATGTLPLSYQWNFNGSAIPGSITSSYSILSALPSDTGQYSCTVTNIAGSATSFAATLNVTNAPPPPPYVGGASNVVIVIKGKNE